MRKVKSSIRPNTGYKKARFLGGTSGASLLITSNLHQSFAEPIHFYAAPLRDGNIMLLRL
jgi:hypothetical protein